MDGFSRQNGFFGLSGLGPGGSSSGPTPALSNLDITPEYRGVSFEVDTDTGSGTLYYVVVPAASAAPDEAQIEAGTDGSDVAATYASSTAVGGTDVAVETPRNLASDTAYAMYFVQKVGATYSNIVSDTFTSPLILASGAYNGEDGDFTSLVNATVTEDYADPDGGANAILVTVSSAGGTAAVAIQTVGSAVVYVNGVSFIDLYARRVAGTGFDGIRVTTTNVTDAQMVTVSLVDGTKSNDTFNSSTVTNLGSGLFHIRLSADKTGDPDLTGALQLQFMNGASTSVPRDGSNSMMLWNVFVSDE